MRTGDPAPPEEPFLTLLPIKALAEYLGHSDPGLTLKVYAHLMPSSRDRARKALGRALRPQDPKGRGSREVPGHENAPHSRCLRRWGA